jgi:hypothetical protein
MVVIVIVIVVVNVIANVDVIAVVIVLAIFVFLRVEKPVVVPDDPFHPQHKQFRPFNSSFSKKTSQK